MNEQRNVILAFLISIVVLVGWSYFFEQPRPEHQQNATQPLSQNVTPAQPKATYAATILPRAQVVGQATRFAIETPKVSGSVCLKGAQIDDITFNQYSETPETDSKKVTYLNPVGTAGAYFSQFKWHASDPSIKLPTSETVWSFEGEGRTLKVGHPVTIKWDNGEGLIFKQIFSIDENYMLGVKQAVENTGGVPVTLGTQGVITRLGTPKTEGYMVLHEGLIGYIGGGLEEYKYEALEKEKDIRFQASSGWLGMTDKYWLTALLPHQGPLTAEGRVNIEHFFRYIPGELAQYQSGFSVPMQIVDAGKSSEITHHFFVGPKELSLLDGYEVKLGVEHFDKAVDFGWFYFITKPLFYALTWMNALLGNFGLAILLLTVVVKILFFPLANKSYRSMAKMKELQPKMEQLRERYADDKMRMNQELMEFYKKEKINPMAGCLPMIIQIPVFFSLYKVLFISIEMRQAPFYGWIKDLSAPDPAYIINLFGALPFDPPGFLAIGVWPLIMGASMVLQQRLNPAPSDPIQAKMFMVMPILFTFLLAGFPAGLVIYWAWNNVLSIAQQWVIMKKTKEEMPQSRPFVKKKKGNI